jgi:hypothetical protein
MEKDNSKQKTQASNDSEKKPTYVPTQDKPEGNRSEVSGNQQADQQSGKKNR